MLNRYGFSAETVYYYPIELEKFLNFVKKRGKDNIEDIDETDYIYYRNSLEDNGYDKRIVVKKMSAIKTWIRLMYERNPTNKHFADLYDKVSSVKLTLSKRKEEGGIEPIPFEHFIEILNTASKMDLHTKLFIYLLSTTGGRSQFYGIKLENIDLENKKINVIVKGNKYIEEPIVDVLVDVIVEYLKNRYIDEYNKIKEKLIKDGKNFDDKYIVSEYLIKMHYGDFLFMHGKDVYSEKLSYEKIKKNRRANTTNAERILRRVCETAGLWICRNCGKVGKKENDSDRCNVCNKKVEFVYYTPHQIRKSIATYGHRLGLTLEGTSDLLGHSNIDITKRFYRGKQIEKVREELKGIEEIIRKFEGG